MRTTAMLFKQACRLHTSFTIARYLMSNAHGRWDGAEKAQRHSELCSFYVATVRGVDDVDMVRRGFPVCYENDYQAVHDATQALTDHLDEEIGFPLDSRPDYDKLTPLFFERFHSLALHALGVTEHTEDL